MKEDLLNEQIENALANENVNEATLCAIKFLKKVYGERAVGAWALRDFAYYHVAEEPFARSRFDKNVLQIQELKNRRNNSHGHYKLKYESPYFQNSYLERLDGLFERFKTEKFGKQGIKSFLDWIEEQI